MLPFHLDILPLEQLIPLEKPQVSRIEMIKRELGRTGHCTSPLLVSRMAEQSYLLLQGVNCYYALRELNIPNTVVQLIDQTDDSARFLSWYHLVRNYKPEHLLDTAMNLGLQIEFLRRVEDFDQSSPDKRLLAIFLEDHIYSVVPEKRGLIDTTRSLNALIDSYQACCSLVRIFPDKTHIETGEFFQLGSVLFILPRYNREELVALAQADLKFPPNCLNISRENRVVGLDFPIRVLNSAVDLTEMRDFLRQLIKMRMQSDRSTVFGAQVCFMGRSGESIGRIDDSGELPPLGALIE